MYDLESYPGYPVAVTSGRFVAVPMEFPGAGTFHDLLWCDVDQPMKMIFVFMANTQARNKYDVGWGDVYMGEGTADSVLPPQFLADVRAWETQVKISSASSVTLYDGQNRHKNPIRLSSDSESWAGLRQTNRLNRSSPQH
ncbi:MAG TPA: hypothetical protein VMB47_09860 [Candidatus Aquilonibacter sp.]|nr:hypothetical protein [Candidatus Aquilonibacter sp.]